MACASGIKVVTVVLDGVDRVDLFGGPVQQQGAQVSVGCHCCFGVGGLAGLEVAKRRVAA